MNHSVLLRLIDGLKSVVNHAAKHLVKELRADEAHSDACLGLRNPVSVGVDNRRREAEIDNAVYASRLGEQVNEYGGLVGVAYLPLLGAGYEHPTGFNHDLISHQNLPFEEAARVVERARQVESSLPTTTGKEAIA